MSYNPSKKERNPLVLSFSADSKTWKEFSRLEQTYFPSIIPAAYPTSIIYDHNIFTVYSFDTKTGIKLAISDKTYGEQVNHD